MEKSKLALFEWKQIRRVWNDEKEKWYFSVVDVVWALSWTEWKDIWAYSRKLKQRLNGEWNESVTKCQG